MLAMFILGTNAVSKPPRIEDFEQLRTATKFFSKPLKVVVESEHFQEQSSCQVS
jgi:hypothetical protein